MKRLSKTLTENAHKCLTDLKDCVSRVADEMPGAALEMSVKIEVLQNILRDCYTHLGLNTSPVGYRKMIARTLCEELSFNPQHQSQFLRLNKTVNVIAAHESDEGDIRARVRRYKMRYPKLAWPPTPEAIAKHWPSLEATQGEQYDEREPTQQDINKINGA